MRADLYAGGILQDPGRPDLRVIAAGREVRLTQGLSVPFRLLKDGAIGISPELARESDSQKQAFHLRHALELACLLEGVGSLTEAVYVRAAFAAARTAALFYTLDVPGPAVDEPLLCLAGDMVPEGPVLAGLWLRLREFFPVEAGVPAALSAVLLNDLREWLGRNLALTGPAETLMAGGGDARLRLDPETGLNHYGCSHRPRPWAITFASSTASSVSERGFAGAEAARLRLQRALLTDNGVAVQNALALEVREFLASSFGLPGADRVILAPSGTDCELAALAIAQMGAGGRPVMNILIAPEETGSGVPLAACGRHFASDTARGAVVERGAVIDGFDADGAIEVGHVPLRDEAGDAVPPAELVKNCRSQIAAAVQAGKHVLLHQLDLSKTGLIAPDERVLPEFQADFGPNLDCVVDACQDRLMPERIGGWVKQGRAVMVTGSKFVTGPPFCGALLLPEEWRQRLDGGTLPDGLREYAGRSEWPDCQAVRGLPDGVNTGLVLRWHAAMAEMAAFAEIAPEEARNRLDQFLSGVRKELAARDDVLLLETPAPSRPELSGAWDDLATILCFLIRQPGDEGRDDFVSMGLDDARRVYRWLNADLRVVFGPDEMERRSSVAGRLCHIGQPVAVPSEQLDGACAGALRLSAGARLVSGEPSHEGFDTALRLTREIADAQVVLEKVGLIRRHWERLMAADPVPSYAPARLRDVSVRVKEKEGMKH